MQPKKTAGAAVQWDLERSGTILEKIINPQHPLVRLAHALDWRRFDELFAPTFHPANGRPGLPTRLMVGLQYLKYAYDLSDEAVLAGWLENPYWQFFCGGVYFEHELPVDSSSLTHWRKRIAAAGAEELLAETLRCGLDLKLVKPTSLRRGNVDTTVQPKHIRHPTDARLYDRARERLVAAARQAGVQLRQHYNRVAKRALRRQSGYARAQQFVRARRETKKLKTMLGRVVRDIRRQVAQPAPPLEALLKLADRLLVQQREDHHKLYSIHEPDVVCLAKGKPHRPYEFGCKVSVSTTARDNWVVGALALSGNRYDGHTLADALQQVQRLTGQLPDQVVCDLGYRGHKYEGPCQIEIVNHYRKALKRSVRYWHRRRSAIEPVIGHLKSECRLERNRLKGVLGDQLNAVLAGCGLNFRKLLKGLCALFWRWFFQASFSVTEPHPLLRSSMQRLAAA